MKIAFFLALALSQVSLSLHAEEVEPEYLDKSCPEVLDTFEPTSESWFFQSPNGIYVVEAQNFATAKLKYFCTIKDEHPDLTIQDIELIGSL